MREQVTHIEQVPRMLPVERGHDLAGVKISEADDGHFGEPEFFLDARRYRPDGGLVDATAEHRRDLDLDLCAIARTFNLVMYFRPWRARADMSAGNPALDMFLDTMQRGIDFLQRGLPIRDRDVCEIDIDRKPRHVAQEQIDRRSALEREDGFRATSGTVLSAALLAFGNRLSRSRAERRSICFLRDMPRLSVDIDLTYVPVADRESSRRKIDAALHRIKKHIERGIPGAHVSTSAPKDENTLLS